ncbi:phage holin [Bacillus paranthracis]|uniref:phage holin n=1 Tax=Bacillus paranthracis TaxID=2026186 RepID=UPI00220D4721|nr:phage holin [Bacillus paranthracis]UXR28838.1 holin [Bacillus phage Nachito]
MNINWKIRFQNPLWVTSFVSQILLLVQLIVVGLNMVGVTDFQWTEEVNNYVLTVVNAVLVIFSSLGLVQDPTTKGVTDHPEVLTLKKPE